MCFKIARNFPRPKIAKKAFKIYKILEISNSKKIHQEIYHNFDSLCKEELISPYQRTPYKLGEIKEILHSDLSEFCDWWLAINDAFHSYRTFEDAVKGTGNWGRHALIVEGEIPKGALYMLNKYECVSNKIILNEIMWTTAKVINEPDTIVYYEDYNISLADRLGKLRKILE